MGQFWCSFLSMGPKIAILAMCKSADRRWKGSDRADRADRAPSLRNISHVHHFACPRAHFRRSEIFAKWPPPRVPRLPFWQCANRRGEGGKALIERIGLQVFETFAKCHTLLVHGLISVGLGYSQGGRLVARADTLTRNGDHEKTHVFIEDGIVSAAATTGTFVRIRLFFESLPIICFLQ